jgi:uncharacterized lipoprotein YddW (UPF0748 family)
MRRALLLTTLVGLGCSGTFHTGSDGGRTADGGRPDAQAGLDATVDRDAGPPPVTVGHARELRGAWVASVFNLTWPSRTGLSESASRAEILAILDTLRELRMNAVVVQVRPESDALYRSTLEPWSRFLSGTQGTDPGWDPLEVWIDEGHARGIEVHAWINPYRGMASASSTTAENHVTRTLSAHAIPWGGLIVMDPGAGVVRAHVVSVVRDLVARYDLDGIHFDDYFYPYPGSATGPFPDDGTYDEYLAGGGTLARDDWRRENVNALVREVSEAIAEERDDVRFGISPFGIHRPGMPEGISGLDAYATLYCDAPRWIEEGWVDYLAPQLYWRSTQTAQAFGPLIEWWSARPRDPERSILAGMTLTNLGMTGWTVDEIRTQIELMRDQRASGARGSILYRADQLVDDVMGIRALFRDELNPTVAATPPLASAAGAAIERPHVSVDGTSVALEAPPGARVRAYAIYEQPSGALRELAGGPSVTLAPGTYAISAIDRRGVESAGVPVTID